MNHRTQEPEQSGTHIWLRYATQFTAGERSYTVEMGIPVPVGASAEQREQLLREAEAGMGQLTHVVEKRVSQMLRQPPASTTPGASISSVTPSKAPPAMPQTLQMPQRSTQKPVPAPTPTAQAAHSSASLASTQTTNHEARNEAGEHRTVSMRPSPVPATTMPAIPRFSVGSEANIPLPDFIVAIRENFNLTPKQAMTMLKVKSLTGLNLREALENLQAMVAQGFSDIDQLMAAHPTMQNASSRVAATVRNAQIEPSDQPAQTTAEITRTPSRSLQSSQEKPDEAQDYQQPDPVGATVREQSPTLNSFDEEINPDEQLEEDELEDLEEPDEDAYELSDTDRLRAKELLDEMREMRGTHTASVERVKVLNRLVLQQIEQNQLKQLIQGVWGVTTPAKLKVDQAEHIINWAKQDDFISEVEAVLLLLEEESYARGNR